LEGDADEGWTPVTWRKQKTTVETVADFWREIGSPTPASRFWENGRRSPTRAGTQSSFCRSVDGAERAGLEDLSTCSAPAGSPQRGTCSSPSGVRLARGPRVGSWRGPLPRRRVSPLPVLGDFLDMPLASSSSPSSPTVDSSSPAPVTVPMAGVAEASTSTVEGSIRGVVQTAVNLAPEDYVDRADHGSGDHGIACVPVHPYGLGHLVRRF
jgi:hypothetical protein